MNLDKKGGKIDKKKRYPQQKHVHTRILLIDTHFNRRERQK